MHSAKAVAASPSARQGLVFQGQTAKFFDGYIARLIPSSLRQGGRIEQFKIFCRWCQPQIGRMIQCDSCHDWFHDICIETDSLV